MAQPSGVSLANATKEMHGFVSRTTTRRGRRQNEVERDYAELKNTCALEFNHASECMSVRNR
jgi:hypothetical protein